MKVYIAGPDVFRPDVVAWMAEARRMCQRHGLEALTPLDHGETTPRRIFEGNLELIRASEIIVANLNAFRGVEPDSGTAFELGYALALNKSLWAYVDTMEPLIERVHRLAGGARGHGRDSAGYAIEDFGLPMNLMLAMAATIVEGDLSACIAAIGLWRASA